MTKKIKIAICLSLIFVYCFSINAFASNDSEPSESLIPINSTYGIEQSEAVYETDSTRTTGLITQKTLKITKSGTNLLITGTTVGTTEVTKCGFKTLVIEYRANSSTNWSEYDSYSYLYDSDNSYTLGKTVTVDSGYQYRVVGEHYAYAGLFSTETIDAETGYIQF